MDINGIELTRLSENLWEIPATGDMKVPGRVYISEEMTEHLKGEEALTQVRNVAHLPGIQKYSLAMPDIHWGYGFPIGGVAATDLNEGVISPGGVGYDINCGVRLAVTSLEYEAVSSNKIGSLITDLFQAVPTGVGAGGALKKLGSNDIKQVLTKGAQWAVERGLGDPSDILYTEESGMLPGADPSVVSQRAIERGLDQVGTLGSGNHFLEIDVVDRIFDEKTAEVFGLFKGQLVILIHTGSRGLGYQVCDDYLKQIVKASAKYGFSLPDRQLACAPFYSEEGVQYFSAMQAAANFAWNNRQVIMHLAKQCMLKTFNMTDSQLGMQLLYDVSHNIAKVEEHEIDGVLKKVCVHRKGATRAFPPGSQFIPERYRAVGQPVLIPGDMGRYSFIAVGTHNAMKDTFGSSCHGAGRFMSRTKALKASAGRDIISELKKDGIIVQAKGAKTVAEEMPAAYKDVADVVSVMHNEGITNKVAMLRPVAVIKG